MSGVIDPKRILTNNKARVGDKLILTKPIGTGIISTAIKRQMADTTLSKTVIEIMSRLNNTAAETMLNYDVSAVTDVTGFGLLGHLKEMSVGSKVDAQIDSQQVPLIPGVANFASSGAIPGGTENNLDYVSPYVQWREDIPKVTRLILCDAQTSGGLLIAVNPRDAEKLLAELKAKGIAEAAIIGEITQTGTGKIEVV